MEVIRPGPPLSHIGHVSANPELQSSVLRGFSSFGMVDLE